MDDKDARGIVRNLAPTASMIICTQSRYKRALSAEKLGLIVNEEFRGPHTTVTRSEDAFELAIETFAGEGVCVIGSLYVVGEAIPWWEAFGKRMAHSHKV
jgi:dihydrofolate synthase/folylpolyglutamate synthase